MTQAEAAVIQAAKKWVSARQAMTAADEARQDRNDTERALDQAEFDLEAAVYRLLGREPTIPPRAD